MAAPLLEAQGICKAYGAVQAAIDVDLGLRPSEIVALVGDNGAGKSTVVKMLSGALTPDRGQILLESRPIALPNPSEARRVGIETVYQDLAVADNLDVAANLFLGREALRSGILGKMGFVNHRGMEAEAERLLRKFGIEDVPAWEQLDRLSGGQRQVVAICRAAAWGSKVVILDEPTAALGVRESMHVLEFVRSLRSHGIGVLVVSHNFHHVLNVADRVVVMRHGRCISDVRTGDVSVDDLVELIVGAESEDPERKVRDESAGSKRGMGTASGSPFDARAGGVALG